MFGSRASKAKAAKTVLRSKTGRKAAAKGAKGAFRIGRSNTGQAAGKAGLKGAGRLARGAAKAQAGRKAGKAGAKGLARAGRGAGKYAAKRGKKEIKIAEKNLGSRSSGGSRLLKFGLLAVIGLSIGALAGRLLGSKEAEQDGPPTGGSASGSSSTATPEQQSSGSGGREPGTVPQQAHSDPSSGPLVGTSHEAKKEGVSEDQPEIEQRIRTSIGEDERTRDMPSPNIEVVDGVVELRGEAPSEEAKEAAGEIAAGAEGVSEVRNLIEVDS
ncbi:MAG: BON domain-containing protein [Rubrobacteraceae bacterium]